MDAPLTRLYPPPLETRPLHGLYLAHRLRERAPADRPFIYANYVASLDGRISLEDPATGLRRPPPAITNPRDWRLYLELAAQADAVLTSGRRLRELARSGRGTIRCVVETAEGDLADWRRAHGLPPYPLCLVLSTTLDFPVDELSAPLGGGLALIVGSEAHRDGERRAARTGIEVRRAAQPRVCATDIVAFAREHELRTLYVIGGPQVLYTVLAADLLDRLYLTTSYTVLAGNSFDTLVRGQPLSPPRRFQPRELYLDTPDAQAEQLFATLDRAQDDAHGGRPD